MRALNRFLNGKKRAIAAVAGAILPWCYEYHVFPEKYLKLAAIGIGLLTSWGIGHAVQKAKKDE